MAHEKLLRYKDFLPLIRQLTDLDVVVLLYSAEGELVECIDAEYSKAPYKVGEIVDFSRPEFEQIRRALSTKKKIHNKLGREVFGIAMEGNIIPIIEQNEAIGVLVCTYCTEVREEIKEKSTTLQEDIRQIEDSAQQIEMSANRLVDTIEDIQKVALSVEEKATKATDVIGIISKSAARSNILALNASIEAARAGVAGKGFAVVADEMGKFSKQSGEVAKEIDVILKEIVQGVAKVKEAVTSTNNEAIGQVKNVEDIVKSLTDVGDIATELVNFSQK